MSTIAEAAREHFHHGRPEEAARCIRGVLDLGTDDVDMLNALGVLAASHGNLDLASEVLRHALSIREVPELYNNLGLALKISCHMEEAKSCFERAIVLDPALVAAYNNLSTLHRERGALAEALDCAGQALALDPDAAQTWVNLGNVLYASKQCKDAEAAYRRAIVLNEEAPEAHNNLGNALKEQGRLDEALEAYRRAVTLNPGYLEALVNLGSAHKDRGEPDEALFWWRRVLDVRPDWAGAHTALLNLMLYLPRNDGREIFSEHRAWAERHASPYYPVAPRHANAAVRERRLVVGYVSNDFRNHASSYFIEPVLAAHDHSAVKVICYDTCDDPDEVTARLMPLADVWRKVAALSDDDLAAMVRADEVDILVDLMGHTGRNRLLTFARKPAPVQATWIGYPGTTGLAVMDYWIADRHIADPAGLTDQYCTEQLLPLANFFMCFRPTPESPPVGPLPARSNGFVTFGSFNTYLKLNPDVIALWARILMAVPDSRLFLLSIPEGETQASVRAQFARHGVAESRLELVNRVSHAQFLALHDKVDIALDPFPYNGTTTTLHGLWMGVPIITLAGGTFASRVGMSILENLGLREFVAGGPQEYLDIAVRAANDTGRLSVVRQGLRERMARSPLVDGPGFARELERAYRDMWTKWCTAQEQGR